MDRDLCFAGVFFAGTWVGFGSARHAASFGRRIPGPVGRFCVQIAERLDSLGAAQGRLLLAGLWTVPFSLLNCLTVWILLHGYRAPLPYASILGLIPTLDCFIALPITFSGVGVREVTFLEGLSPFGVSAEVALAVGLTRWSGHLFRAVLGGFLFVLGRR